MATEGKIYHSVHTWTLSSHYYYGGTLFTGSVMCFLSAWVLHIHWQIEDILHMQTEELVLKRKLSSMLTQLFAYFQSINGLCPADHAKSVLLIQTLSYS